MPIPRVAVIAVHGVADQQPGDTARAVAELLVSSAPGGVRYASTASDGLTLRVEPLPPQASAQPHAHHGGSATPRGEDRPLLKSLAQSARSDFQRQQWAAQPGARAAAKDAAIGAPPTAQDRGIAVTNYLLSKHLRNGARPEVYETTRLSLERRGAAPDAGPSEQIDVYEMYWADLSRLSGSVPRIVSELFTLVFRLSKLGRETVDEMWGQLARSRDPQAPFARAHAFAWNVLAWLQIGLDWLFVNGLALLFTQLALLGVLLVFLGYTSGIVPDATADYEAIATAARHEQWLHRGVAGALCVLAALRLVYRRAEGGFVQTALAVAVLALGACALAVGPAMLQWVTALTLLTALTVFNEWTLRIADDRFPLVHAVGRWMWAASALLMLGSAITETRAVTTPPWRDVWVHAALFTTETVLLLIKWWWIVAGPLLVAWFLAGLAAARESGYASRASVATGRLGLTVSLGMFLVTTMTIWALANGVLGASVAGEGYRPCIFAMQPAAGAAPLPASVGANTCMWTSRNAKAAAAVSPMPAAGDVLVDRYEKSTSAFSLLATLLLMLVAWLLTMFAPSVAAELKLIVAAKRNAHQRVLDRERPRHDDRTLRARTRSARDLGRWLTAGFRRLDLVVIVITATGVALSLVIALLFLASTFEQALVAGLLDRLGLAATLAWLDGLEKGVSGVSQTLFSPFQAAVFSAAGAGAALSVLGGQLSRRIPSLRGPLDVALDVDNHFREFPRTDIPRAHIFSRYAALLEHVRAQGVDRIVVVAHSQGTVISAELLRFLSSRDQRAPTPGDTPRLAAGPLPPVSLLTLGCPLRQLYGARFPGLYAWVLAKNGPVFGPLAADVGAQRWMNAFCSGDYVGRWLWSSAGHDAALAHPMINTVAHDRFGRVDAYTGFNPWPPLDAPLRGAREAEVCLGLGAHTHYLEPGQGTVAWMIDWLIRAPAPDAQHAGAGPAGPVVTLDATAGAPARVVGTDASVVSDGAPAPAAAPDEAAPPHGTDASVVSDGAPDRV